MSKEWIEYRDSQSLAYISSLDRSAVSQIRFDNIKDRKDRQKR